MRIPGPTEARRAVAGIIAALILFVMLFTIGSGYFVYQSVLSHDYDVAKVNAEQQAQAKASEQLGLTTFLSGGLSATVTNTGGVPVVLTGMFVEDPTQSASLVCVSPKTGTTGTIPVNCPNYSAPSLSIPIDIGAKPTISTGQAVTCSTQASPCTFGIITQRGNVFTQAYPMPATTTAILQTATSISTLLSSTSITFGNSVYDTATLTGVTATAAGTVTYHFFDNPAHTDNTCSGPGVTVSTVTVTNGIVPPSGSESFPTAANVGSYSWDAVYSGDANNNAATSTCEPMTVTKYTPTLTTLLGNNGVIVIGSSETDTATLSNAYNPSSLDSITFNVYRGSCSGSPVSIGTVPLTPPFLGNGQYQSGSYTPPGVGTYFWTAIFSGDSNNNPVTSQCELLVVQTTTSSAKTNPTITTTLFPTSAVAGTSVTDSATFLNTSPPPTGLIAFEAFSASSGCSGAPAYYSNPIVVNGLGPWGPSTPSFYPSVAGSPGYYFQVIYTGDGNYNPVITLCSSEPLSVTKATPAITTTLSSANIVAGQSVTDTSTLVGSSGSNAGGMVTFYYSSATPTNMNPCTISGPTTVGSFPVTGGSAVSTSTQFNSVGTFYWYAVYSTGDSNNNAGATSACEQLSSVAVSGSAVASGIGSIQMNFNSFKWFSVGACTLGTSVCTLTPWNAGGGVKNDPNLGYTISKAAVGTNHLVFSVNITNADPLQRTIILDQYSQILFFDPTSSQQPSGAIFKIVNVNLATHQTQTGTPSLTLTYNQPATVFLGIPGGGGLNNLSTPPVLASVFLFFHGQIGIGPAGNYGQNLPFATTLWNP